MKPSTSLGTRSNVGMAKPSPPVRQAGNIGRLLVIHGVCRRSVPSRCPQVKYRCRCRDIDWETFEDNLRIMHNNATKTDPDEAVGAVRAGKALLAGLLRCGHCGRKMHVSYWGKSGTSPRYRC